MQGQIHGPGAAKRESILWTESYERVAEQAATLPDTRLVYATDREGDITALMKPADESRHPADWLIRSQHNRKSSALWETVELSAGRNQPHPAGTRGPKGAPGQTDLAIPTREATGYDRDRCHLRAGAEIGAPAGVPPPVVWRLLTNREASDIDAVVELIDWYRARWEIEMFFHVLKNGCKVEARQLSQFDRLEPALALYMVAAWRIARLMRLGRTCPDLDATLFFRADEIRGAFLLAKKPRPKRPSRSTKSFA